MWPFTTSYSTTERISKLKLDQRSNLIAEGLVLAGGAAPGKNDEEMLASSASEIVRNIESRKPGWTATSVLKAYIRSSAEAQERTNCLTEILYEPALLQAAALDKHHAATDTLVGPLHGVPISVKDQFAVGHGKDNSIGMSRYCYSVLEVQEDGRKKEEEGSLVRAIREAGGVVFCKTNVPQTMLAFECSNPIFGRTINPYSPNHSCGGSSGGEAALLALDGSALGFGTDIGGSLRIPAAYSGIYSIKGGGRLPMRGTRGVNEGYEGIKTSAGPMARSIDDLQLALEALISSPSYTPIDQVLPIPFREDKMALPAKLKIGYFVDDGFLKSSPACARAVMESVEALRSQGHDCIEWTPPNAWEALEIFAALSSGDGYKNMLSKLTPDPKEPSMQLTTLGPSLPRWVRYIAHHLIISFFGDSRFARLLGASRAKSVGEFWSWTAKRDAFAQKMRQSAWVEHKFDFILSPTQAVPAVPHLSTTSLPALALSTILFNVVDSTVGVLPITHVSSSLDALTPSFLAQSSDKLSPSGGASTQGSPLMEAAVYKGEGPLARRGEGGKGPVYDAKGMEGLPVAVQVVLPLWEEERCLGAMRVVEEALQGGRSATDGEGRERKFGPGAARGVLARR